MKNVVGKYFPKSNGMNRINENNKENKMKRFYYFAFVLFTFFSSFNFLHSEIEYKISGNVSYNGKGINNIIIECVGINKLVHKRAKTKDSIFYFFVPSGIYRLILESQNGYVDTGFEKNITVNNKNINNIIFLLEKECVVSGKVIFSDSTPVINCRIIAKNERGFSFADTNDKGEFTINAIKSSEKTEIEAQIQGAETQKLISVILNEGDKKYLGNFTVPKGTILKGKVIDKTTKTLLENVWVVIRDKNKKNVPIQTMTDENGIFIFYNLKAGEYLLYLKKPLSKYKPIDSTTIFNPNNNQDILIELEQE